MKTRRAPFTRNKDQRESLAAIARTRSEEEHINRDAAQLNNTIIQISNGAAAYRPSSDYLKQHGIKGMLYFSTDTFVLSAWTGTLWKTVTLA